MTKSSIRIVSARKIVAVYVLVAVAWILLSDRILGMMVNDHQTLTRLQPIKGGLFVLVTGALLYFLVQRSLFQMNRLKEEASQ